MDQKIFEHICGGSSHIFDHTDLSIISSTTSRGFAKKERFKFTRCLICNGIRLERYNKSGAFRKWIKTFDGTFNEGDYYIYSSWIQLNDEPPCKFVRFPVTPKNGFHIPLKNIPWLRDK